MQRPELIPDRTQFEWRMNMFYITYVYNKTDTNEQLSFEDLFNADGSIKTLSTLPSTNTRTEYRTVCTQFLLPRTQTFFNRQAQQFTNQFAERLSFYADKDMHEFYTEFSIPKHSGGFRTINAPKEDLKRFQREMKDFLENIGMHPHTAAYAYVRYRTAKDAVVKHAKTKHTCYLKLDFHNFFGSCSEETIRRAMSTIPFFCALNEETRKNFIHVVMLDGGLPQGTPISPWLTNQIMLHYDFRITQCCNPRKITYTRYADDMLFSADNKTALREAKRVVDEILRGSNFTLNNEKTRISTIYGKNWNLGLMTNKDNEITVGWRAKERARATLHNFIADPNALSCQQASEILGKLQYYQQIEPEYFGNLFGKYSEVAGYDVRKALIKRIKGMEV